VLAVVVNTCFVIVVVAYDEYLRMISCVILNESWRKEKEISDCLAKEILHYFQHKFKVVSTSIQKAHSQYKYKDTSNKTNA